MMSVAPMVSVAVSSAPRRGAARKMAMSGVIWSSSKAPSVRGNRIVEPAVLLGVQSGMLAFQLEERAALSIVREPTDSTRVQWCGGSDKIHYHIDSPWARQILLVSAHGPLQFGFELSPLRCRQLVNPTWIAASAGHFFRTPICVFLDLGRPSPGLLGFHDAARILGTSEMLAHWVEV